MWETWVRSLGQEGPLKKEMATHSATLAWKIPWTEKPSRLQSTESKRVGHGWVTSLSLSMLFKHLGSWKNFKILELWHQWRWITICCSVTQSCLTLHNPMDCSTPGFPVLHHLSELAQIIFIESVKASNHLVLCCPLLLPSIFPSIRVFSNESALRIRWPKH